MPRNTRLAYLGVAVLGLVAFWVWQREVEVRKEVV